MMSKLKAPFPYFGGKSTVSDIVWSRLGNPDNYVEPFAGTAAVLLRRPVVGKAETISDANHYVANFWRAVTSDPEQVAQYADGPVSEVELHSRHQWLVASREADQFKSKMLSDPDYYDAKIAGWWVWGQSCWIGGGWCQDMHRRRPNLGNNKGVNVQSQQVPDLAGESGRGVCASSGHNRGRPQLGDAFDIGRGVNSNRSAGTTAERRLWLTDWMQRLQDRLRLVRTCYGHWSRICDSHTTMTRLGVTGAFLDPPYAKDVKRLHQWVAHLDSDGPTPNDAGNSSNRSGSLYHGDESQDIDKLVAEVHLWCRKWGQDSNVRIALCGYAGEHDPLESKGWQVVEWKAQGGYGNQGGDNVNKHRERLWFSPACQREKSLFD